MIGTARRAGLLVLTASGLVVGAWALLAPRSFYDSFPGIGSGWVHPSGPYNEHLVTDVGAAYLALAAASLLALASASRAFVSACSRALASLAALSSACWRAVAASRASAVACRSRRTMRSISASRSWSRCLMCSSSVLTARSSQRTRV